MRQSVYEHKSLTKLILIFGIPSILSLMIEMLTGIVDTAFAGNLPGIGGDALSAMALLSPVLGIFTALQTLFAMSTGILLAKYLNDPRRQDRSYAAGVAMTLAVALTSSALCHFMLPHILTALGARGQILSLAGKYLQIQLLSNIFSSLGYTLTCCIRAFGHPKMEVVVISTSVVVNIVCNFLFSFVFQWGMAGLAWGTFASESVCAIFAMAYLIKKKLWIRKSALLGGHFFSSVGELFKIGISQTAIQVLGGCTGFFVNARLLQLGTMAHVAAWSVVQRIYTFILMPVVGLTQGVQNIISYFNGNHAPEKTKKVAEKTMLFCSSYGILALLGMVFFGHNLVGIFGGSGEILAIARTVLFLVFLGFPFIGVLYTDMTLLQVTGHEFSAVLLILSRQVFFLVPLVYLIPALAALGHGQITPVIAVFFCMPIADLLSAIFSWAVKKKLAAQ